MVDHFVGIRLKTIVLCIALGLVTSCRDVFFTIESVDVRDCLLFCERDPRCVTYYFKGTASGQGTCNLSEFGLQTSPGHQGLAEVLTRVRDDGPWEEHTTQQIRPALKNNKDCSQDKTSKVTSPVDYCATGKHNCSMNANCTAVAGTFKCTCTDGYLGDGVICDRTCTLGWQLFDESCYHMYTDTKSWQDASLTCQSNKANLVSITSLEENNFVRSLIRTSVAWIGLFRSGSPPSLAWSDGSTLGYNNWYSREPDKSGDCVYMRFRDGKWRDWSCSTMSAFICKS